MRFVTIERENYSEPGLLAGEEVVGLRRGGFSDLLSVIAGGADALDRVRRWVDDAPGDEVLDAENPTCWRPSRARRRSSASG